MGLSSPPSRREPLPLQSLLHQLLPRLSLGAQALPAFLPRSGQRLHVARGAPALRKAPGPEKGGYGAQASPA